MQPLTPEAIESGRHKILSNASQLTEEAELLLKAGHNARAYALACLASEELAKIPMLVRASASYLCDIEFDWDELERKLKSHYKKLEGILAIDFLFSSGDFKLLKEDWDRIPNYNKVKNWSIYVSCEGGEFVEPADIFTAAHTTGMVKLARNRLTAFNKMEKGYDGWLERARKDPRLLSEMKAALTIWDKRRPSDKGRT
jgi:AbiV family abortive infection protein